MKNFFEDGVKYGEKISRCTYYLIVDLIAERARMYEMYAGIEESNQFVKGAASAIISNVNVENDVIEKNKQIEK